MPRFIQVGANWINLEVVAIIELVEDNNQPGKVVTARVHYTTGKEQDFNIQRDVQTLTTFVKNHQVAP